MSIASIKSALSGLKSLVIGLGVTGRAFCDKNVTVIYPREEVDNLSTYRGHVELIGKEDAPSEPKCMACGICARACPSNCFTILCPVPAKDGETCNPAQMGPAPQKGSKTPAEFILDFSLCSLCGQCVKACATGGLQYSNNPYMTSVDRNDFKFDLIELLRKEALKRVM